MTKKVVFIHTVNTLDGLFNTLGHELIPDAELSHISDESLIRSVLDAGGLTPSVYRRICEHVVAAEQQGADIIQVTCSSVSPCVDVAKHLVSVPVLKIDEPMIEYAVSRFRKIGVIATAPTTLKPTTDLVNEKARTLGHDIEVNSILCAGAYDAFLSGDMARHDNIVRDMLRNLMKKVEAVLLAQASMARLADTLDEKEKTVPILSSPRPAMEHLASVLRSESSHTGV